MIGPSSRTVLVLPTRFDTRHPALPFVHTCVRALASGVPGAHSCRASATAAQHRYKKPNSLGRFPPARSSFSSRTQHSCPHMHRPGLSRTKHLAPHGQTLAPTQRMPPRQSRSLQQPDFGGDLHTPITTSPGTLQLPPLTQYSPPRQSLSEPQHPEGI